MFNQFPIQSQPWLLIGDFNEILDSHEKWGGDSPAPWRIILFREFLRGRQLRDLHSNGLSLLGLFQDTIVFILRKGWIEL